MPKSKTEKLRKRLEAMTLKNKNNHPRRVQKRLRWLALMLSLLWIMKTQVTAEEYWTFIPNPPVMHPVTIALIATAATATISLTESIQTAEFVNELSHNVSVAFQTQEEWDRNIEQKLNALYDTVKIVGDELNSLEIKSSLKCHSMFTHICMTPFPYNSTEFPWDRIRNHLLGIWHNCNTSLDLANLHKQIQDMVNAPPIDIDIVRDAKNFLSALAKQFPTFEHFIYSWIEFGVFIIILLLLLPCIIRLFISQINRIYVDLKRHKLKMTEHMEPVCYSK